jgi:hypothetical protein
MIGPEFASCWLKIGRAEEHLNSFKTEFPEWDHKHPYVISRKCNAEGSRHSLVIDIVVPPPIDRWSLIAADCIHNLRSALDNWIYALAVKQTGSVQPPHHNRLQFPITDTPEAFQQALSGHRLASVSSAAQGRVEALQPYNRKHAQLPPLLGMLRDFDDKNKHRLLNVAFQQVHDGRFSFKRPVIGTPKVFYSLTGIKSGTEVAFFLIDPPQPSIDYEYEVSLVICLDHALSPLNRSWSELGYLLRLLIDEVTSIVNAVV